MSDRKIVAPVPRKLVTDFVEALGFDADQVRTVYLEWNRVTVEVYALNSEGARFAVGGSEAVAYTFVVDIAEHKTPT